MTAARGARKLRDGRGGDAPGTKPGASWAETYRIVGPAEPAAIASSPTTVSPYAEPITRLIKILIFCTPIIPMFMGDI